MYREESFWIDRRSVDISFSFIVMLLPILYQYSSPIKLVSLGEFLLIPFLIFYVLTDFHKKRADYSFHGLYLLMAIVLSVNVLALMVQSFASFEDSSTIIARLLFYALLIYVARFHFDLVTSLRIYIPLVCVISAYIILQFFVKEVADLILPNSFAPSLILPSEQGIRLDYQKYYQYYFRPSGVFLEPSYFAFYAAPALPVLMDAPQYIYRMRKKNLRLLLLTLIVFSIIISTSSAGLIFIIVALGIFFCRSTFEFKKKTNSIFISISNLAFGVIMILISMAILLSSFGKTLMSRTLGGGSLSTRVFRGATLSKTVDIKTFFLGTGINNVENYVRHYAYYTEYDESNLNYVATIFDVFLSSGFFVFICYSIFLLNLSLIQKSSISLTLTLFLCAYSVFEMTAYSYRFGFYLILIFAAMDIVNTKNNEPLPQNYSRNLRSNIHK